MFKSIKQITKNLQNPELVEAAFNFAEKYYAGKEENKKAYLDHILKVASILKGMGLDEKTLIASLLHDAIDNLPSPDKKNELNKIEKKFDKEIAMLVSRISDVGKLRYFLKDGSPSKQQKNDGQSEDIVKMFFALAQDLRVILIQLASRLDNMRRLDKTDPEKQKLYAEETVRIAIPTAERLGIGELKSQLEDLSFSYLMPEKYEWVKSFVKEEYAQRRRYLKLFGKRLKKIFKKEKIRIKDINWRPKTYWSIYKKLLKKNKDISQVHDLLAMRIIAENINDCYKILGIIHKYYKPIEEEIDDYVAKPKINGYRSLHTTVYNEDGHITEIQIRTPEMHKEAEFGICAHWAYKESVNLIKNEEDLALSEEVPDFWKTFKIDFYSNRVFVFTPKDDIINLPKGSTPVDFAYAVHSDVGNHCDSAKVNGKMVNLSHQLANGDVVEIITNKKRQPSEDWLKFVKSNLAVSHIKKELAKRNIISKIRSFGELPAIFKKKVVEVTEKIKSIGRVEKGKKTELVIDGQKGISVVKAKCCKPVPGDEIVAYLSKYRSAVLHKKNCSELAKLAKKFPNKITEAHWE